MSIFPTSFFGLTIHPGQAYATVLEDDTHITMASLSSALPKNGARTSVVLKVDNASFTLCSLTPGKNENQNLDIYLNEGDEVSFTVVGLCPIDITGNVIIMLPPGGEDDEFDSDQEDLMSTA